MMPSYPSRPYRVLSSSVCSIKVRQQPQYAVVTSENKEKMRRPVDPPPIVQLSVHPSHDPHKEYLVNPFLFMTASLVEADEQEQGGYRPVPGVQIIGQNVSSLHRLKDESNTDGGFFVFGDISCRTLGVFRLQFNLFDFDKGQSQVAFVMSLVSTPFRVVSQKEFKGLSESTHLSRTFSDQGVRLRLRKEPRSITGSKRGYDSTPQDAHGMYAGGPVSDRSYGYETPSQKRARSGSDHTAHDSASSQFSGHYGYSNNASAWTSQPHQSFQSEQSPYGLASHLQPHMGPNPSYQRYIQHDPYSTDSLASNGNYYSTNSRQNAALARYPLSATYTQPNQGYESNRTSRDMYSLPSLNATAPLPDSGVVSNQNHDYSASHTSGQPSSLTSGMLPQVSMHQDQDGQRSVNQYEMQSLPIHSANQMYQTNSHSDTGDSVYGQSSQHDIKYGGQNNYQATNNMYSDAPASSNISDSALPLDSGMLNSRFAPPNYDSSSGQRMDVFKQEPVPYPTPNQTSSMG